MRSWASLAVVILLTAEAACAVPASSETEGDPADDDDTEQVTQEHRRRSVIKNNKRFRNGNGAGGTYSTLGAVDLESEFHTSLGTNGRSCASCHSLSAGWSITPAEIKASFNATGGTAPLFNIMDADRPDADLSTVASRRAAFSMLIDGAVFRRGGPPPATREYEIIAADDPHGVGNLTRFSFYRRSMPTAALHLANNVHWDDGVTVPGNMRQGLFNQARGNIINGQQGAPPADATVDAIVDYELTLSYAQIRTPDAKRLDACGARGGPEHLANQAYVQGRFNLFDAWGTNNDRCSGKKVAKARRAIYRGQELFNTKTNASGRTCRGCHDAENNGSNVAGALFDVGASGPAWRTARMPIFTVQNRTTLETRQTTDPGKAFRSGRWADMDRFKVPSLRGLSGRAPYFHNGIAKTLPDVVHFYEKSLGFRFNAQEEADLVAFLGAL